MQGSTAYRITQLTASDSTLNSIGAGWVTEFDDLGIHLLDHQKGVPSNLNVPHASIICSLHYSQLQSFNAI